jgi:hypothetical protein
MNCKPELLRRLDTAAIVVREHTPLTDLPLSVTGVCFAAR